MASFELMVQEIRTMGLPALLSFHTVAHLGGVSAAAKRLGLAKSGVSRHVAQLEAHFGVKLMERGARSVRLTPVGARLDQRIRSILAEVDLLGDIVEDERAGVSGQVTVAATPEFGGLIATHVFPEILARHPDLSLVMRPAYEFEDMQDPGTDLAFRIGSFHDDRLVARRLGQFRRWLVASPELAERHPIRHPEDLAGLNCLTFRGDRPGATWSFEAGGETTSVEVKGAIAVRSFGILLDLARAGRGIAFLPQFMLGEALARGELVRCLPALAEPPVSVFLTFRPGTRNIARAAAVIAAAEEVVPTLIDKVAPPGA